MKDSILVSFLYKAEPDETYEMRVAKNALTNFTGSKYAEALEYAFENSDQASVYTISSVLATEAMTDSMTLNSVSDATLRLNGATTKVRSVYGTEYSWISWANSSAHSPVVLRIRQDLSYGAEKMGLTTLPGGITVAAAAVSLADLCGVAIPALVAAIGNVLSLYSGADYIEDNVTIETYKVTACYLRYGTVKPTSNSAETAYATATKNIVRCVIMDSSKSGSSSSDYADYMTLVDDVETLYIPSEYAYGTSALMQEAYNNYIG
jgi:hypothetical protein